MLSAVMTLIKSRSQVRHREGPGGMTLIKSRSQVRHREGPGGMTLIKSRSQVRHVGGYAWDGAPWGVAWPGPGVE